MSTTTDPAVGTPGGDWPGLVDQGPDRHEPDARERLLVGGYVAGGAVAAAAVAAGGPGGWAHALQAAVLVGLVALAGARARRWTLALLCAAGVVLGTGWLVVAPVLGGAAVALLYAARARSRTWGAAIGALGGLGLLALRDLGVPRLSALVAGVLALLVVASGYKRSRSRTRRRARRVAVVVAVVAVVAAGVGVAALLQSRPVLEGAVDTTVAGARSASDGRTAVAATEFSLAQQDFAAAAGTLDRWWTLPARALPVLGDNFRVLLTMARAGESLTGTAAELVSTVDYGAVSAQGGGVDLAVLSGFAATTDLVVDELDAASVRLDGAGSPWLVGPVDDRLDELSRRVDRLRSEAATARLAALEGPALLGADRPRRYLVLLGSPAELRDLGGHLGNWAEVVVDQGRLELVQVGAPGELALPPEVDAELATRLDGPGSGLVNLRPATFPQNWGGSPDFDVVTDLSAELFERSTGRPVDGVVYADAGVLDAMLAVTGPVPVPGLTRTLAAGEAVPFLTREQYEAYPTETQADAAVRDLIEDVFERFTAATLPGPRELAGDFGPLVAEGRLRMASTDGVGDELLGRVGLDRELEPPDGGDVLVVLNRNANPSKVDAFLRRDVDHRVWSDPASGRVRARTVVELVNDAPSTGLPTVVIGNRQGLPDGTNLTDLAILSTLRLTAVEVDGEAVSVTPATEGSLNRYTARVALPPGGRRTVTFDLEGQVAPGSRQQLRVVRQPLLGAQTVTVRRLDSAAALRGAGAVGARPGVVLEGGGSDDVRLAPPS